MVCTLFTVPPLFGGGGGGRAALVQQVSGRLAAAGRAGFEQGGVTSLHLDNKHNQDVTTAVARLGACYRGDGL